MAYTNENQQLMQKLSGEISKVIKGKGEAVQLILTALLAQGQGGEGGGGGGLLSRGGSPRGASCIGMRE